MKEDKAKEMTKEDFHMLEKFTAVLLALQLMLCNRVNMIFLGGVCWTQLRYCKNYCMG